ncbi:MAG: hypothetical protein OZSIB_0110 [Candidatus Ozemobacter sibiricus]|jgi:HEAT repeat protein|uniref:HEAT repeat domain-containing protein n=1 Tax=Candidatus Ozemobacter sibiricus TaxID=2268124 RepID=A0A367Z8Z9_9BACT|nr:MAG: hypothetical protein OZSIB_0110 [Candidatus Ozemobacter sibiricus]
MTEPALSPVPRPESAGPGGASFVELLERAFGQPETFAATVLPEVRARPEQTLPVLLRVFDSPNVVAKNLVADLFRGPLREAGRPLLLAELSSGAAERFYWASVILADLQVGDAVPLLVKALTGRPTPTVLAALRALARFDRPEAREAILAFFLTARDEVQLSSSIRILEGLAGFLVPRLLERFAGLDQARQAWVLKFLAETGAPAALEVFSQTLARDPCTLGVFCIRGLGRIGTPAAVAALTQHLGHREWFLRKKVVEALGQAKTVEAIPPLIAALTDAAVQVRAAAIESLSKVGGLAPRLMIEAFDRAPPVQKIGLIRAMGQIGDRAFLPVLVGALQDRSLLFFGLDALGDLGQPEGAEALRPFLTDAEWFNRMNALEALAKLDPPNLADLAQTCLQDPNDMVRNAAARILARARPAS